MNCLFLIALLPLCAHAWVPGMENRGLHEGDMVLNPGQMKEAKEGHFTYGSIRTGLWTKVGNYVTIPYDADSVIAGSTKAMNAVKAAHADYHKFTCLRFVPRNGERAYIRYRGSGARGCSSPVGMTGGMNRISLASGCWSRATVIHEIGHSIGLYHEQSRPDRDGFIKVRWENIPKNIQYNFHAQTTDRVTSHGTPYDYRSVMHYGKTAFGSGKVTMQTIDPYYTDLIGAASGFSDIDVEQINTMYGCPKYNGIVEKVKQTPDCHDGTSYCEMLIADYGCNRMKSRCPFSCKTCTPGGGPVPTYPPVPTQGPTNPPKPDCKDRATNCKDYSDKCNNVHWRSFQKKWCARTCNFC